MTDSSEALFYMCHRVFESILTETTTVCRLGQRERVQGDHPLLLPADSIECFGCVMVRYKEYRRRMRQGVRVSRQMSLPKGVTSHHGL